MQEINFNNFLRTMFAEFVEKENISIRFLCKATLGIQSMQDFKKFLDGEKKLGNTTLNRLINNLGYEIHYVPIKKSDDEDKIKKIKEYVEEFKKDSIADILKLINEKEFPDKKPGKPVNQSKLNAIRKATEIIKQKARHGDNNAPKLE